MPSPEEIRHQQTLLNTYRRNLTHFVRQAASYGGEDAAPIHISNNLDDTRANINRIKGILLGWGVQVDDLPDEGAAAAQATAQQPSISPYPPTPADIPQLQTAPAAFKYDVFISYSSADEEWVEQTLLKTLEDAGLHACIDFRDFPVGRPTIINIQNAVLESRHTVLVITQNWIKSEWTLFESLLIRTKDPGSLHNRTIPLRLDPVELPDFISMLTWVDFTRADRHALAWRKLFAALTETDSDTKKLDQKQETELSSLRPLPPERIAEGNPTPAAQASPNTTQASPAFREVKMQRLNKRLENLIAEYEAVMNQIDYTANEGERVRLKRQAATLEEEIGQIESDLRSL